MRYTVTILSLAAVLVCLSGTAGAAILRLVLCDSGMIVDEFTTQDADSSLEVISAFPSETPCFIVGDLMGLMATLDEDDIDSILDAIGWEVEESLEAAIVVFSAGDECLTYYIDPEDPTQYTDMEAPQVQGLGGGVHMWCCVAGASYCASTPACESYRPDCCNGISTN